MSYKSLISFIVDGQLVQAGVANRAPRELQGNVDYLKQILEEALIGSTVFVRDATVEIDAQEGQPVFYNPTNLRYERAKAAIDTDATTGFLVTASSSWVWGVLHRKLSATKADILVAGVSEINFSQAISGTPVAGMYYLSGVTQGALTAQEPPVTIPVLMVGAEGDDGRYECIVRPDFRDLLVAHKHFRFPLVCEPAGDHAPPAPGGTHEITNPEPAVEGWLPADQFTNAPAGAVFGYNIAASTLNSIWPPIPVTNATLELFHPDGEDAAGHPIVGGPVPNDLCIIDEFGIWWTSDCYGQVPWPTTFDSTVSASISEDTGCPFTPQMQAIFWFGRPQFHNTSTAVLSLRAKTGSGLEIVCLGTDDPATAGHLEIDLDLDFLVNNVTTAGYVAFKGLTEDGKFNLGPIVEAIKAGSANVQISSSVEDKDGYHYGKLTIAVDQNVDGTQLDFETIRLDGAEEEYYEGTNDVGVIGIGLDPNYSSGFTGRIKIPDAAVLPSGTKMKLRLLVLAREAGIIPASVFSAEYRILSRPSAPLTPVTLSTTETAITIDSNIAVEEDEYVEMESTKFDIVAGDIVLINIYRAGSDGFAGDLHVIHKQGVLVVA